MNPINYHFNKAFTLLELLITLSIFTILSISGIYYYQDNHHKTKLTLFSQQFYFDLMHAKELAITQQCLVTVCPISPNWESGYQIQAGKNLLLERTPAYFSDLAITPHFGLNQTCVIFDNNGHSLFNGHIAYHLKKTPQKKPDIKIILTQTGKIRLETT